nr:unnamed protein product [Spirometra erinaceieuropaei]
MPPTNSVNSSETPLPSSSSSSSSSFSSSSAFNSSSSSNTSSSTITAPTTVARPAVSHIINTDTTADTDPNSADSSDEDQDYICPYSDRTFTLHIGLVSHLRIHRTEAGEPVPGSPTYTHRTRLHCQHCTRTFVEIRVVDKIKVPNLNSGTTE